MINKFIDQAQPIKTIAQALDIVKGLSEPSKLPCYSYNIPAAECRQGGRLRKVKNSVCSDCYAMKGLYRKYKKTVDPAQRRRFRAITDPRWVEAMSFLVNRRKLRFFRWFDSGDLQSVAHLAKIVDVANNCPGCKFWLPTREYNTVSAYCHDFPQLPSNLILRLSAHIIDGPAPQALAHRLGVKTSTVVTNGASCPAKQQNNQCLDCRQCWDEVENVSYRHQ